MTKDKGWQINENGDSVFNNTLVRGTVELPQAGMTDYGSTGNDNLIKNSNFRNGNTNWTTSSLATYDKNKKCDEAYSFKISTSGLTENKWTGTRQTVINETISTGSTYTVSGYYFVENVSLLDGGFACELKGTKADGSGDVSLGAYPSWNKSTACLLYTSPSPRDTR